MGAGMIDEAPKRIWVSDSILSEAPLRVVCCREKERVATTNPTPYVRADIADGLLAALKEMDSLATRIKSPAMMTMSDAVAHAACRAAIAKAEDTE